MPRLFKQLDVFNRKKIASLENEISDLNKRFSANYMPYTNPYYRYSPIYIVPYDGEKTPGEMGAAKNYLLMYDYLRIRSWQAYLESEIAQFVINKFILWTIGSGLKLQSEPIRDVLQQEGIKLSENFVKQSESRFNLWTRSRYSDSCKMNSVDLLASEAKKNAIVGGDCVIILRVENGLTDMQLIDGSHVVSPFSSDDYFRQASEKGNRIEYGVEINKNNEHVAYYIHGADNKIHRVPRYGDKSGRLMAYMVYGNRYRVDNVRGLPLICAVLETIKKLDRYKEATVGSAEERQKIAYAITHNADSTGENPLTAKIIQAGKMNFASAPESQTTDEYEATATHIALTTNKQAFNMPIGSDLKLLESKNELYFKDFYTTNIMLVCASVGIPYEVAMSMYNSNYSASRAAIKDWEHSMKTSRENFAAQFYQNFYNLWLEVEILNGKIQADGYLKATKDNNIMAIEAYRSARWMGVNVPQIDPVKEITAARLKLGDQTTPLASYDQVTEELGTGDFTQIIEKVIQEKKKIPKEKEESKKNGKAPVPEDLLKEFYNG